MMTNLLSSGNEQLRISSLASLTQSLITKSAANAHMHSHLVISGVSYTSECTPCEAGFYNDEEGRGR